MCLPKLNCVRIHARYKIMEKLAQFQQICYLSQTKYYEYGIQKFYTIYTLDANIYITPDYAYEMLLEFIAKYASVL